MKKVLLTGADGFLGSNLTRELLMRGYSVKAYIQHGSISRTIDGLDIEKVEGDILSPSELKEAVKGCSYLIHAAASTSIWPSRSDSVKAVNIEGTRNIISAALENKIEKMVYVGTANSFNAGTIENPGDEDSPYKGRCYNMDYIESKYFAQLDVMAAVREKGLPAVIVNPTFMLGPFDSKPGTGAMILAVAQGKIPGYTRGGRNFVYVKDVATGIVNALEKGETGQNYILGNRNMTYKEAFALIADTLKVKRPVLYLPPFISYAYSFLATSVSWFSGKAPKVSISMAKSSNDGCYYSPDKAVKRLDLPQTEIEVAIRESYEWLLDNGYVKL